MGEVGAWLMEKVKKDGVFSLYQIVEGQPVLKSITNFEAAKDLNEMACLSEQLDSQWLEQLYGYTPGL